MTQYSWYKWNSNSWGNPQIKDDPDHQKYQPSFLLSDLQAYTSSSAINSNHLCHDDPCLQIQWQEALPSQTSHSFSSATLQNWWELDQRKVYFLNSFRFVHHTTTFAIATGQINSACSALLKVGCRVMDLADRLICPTCGNNCLT